MIRGLMRLRCRVVCILFIVIDVMGEFINKGAQEGNLRTQAGNSRAQGIAQKAQKYQEAYSMERDSARNAYIVGDNMMRTRQNQTSATAQVRASAGASGFSASSGSKLTAEQSVAQIFEQQIADMGKSYSISDSNAREQANMNRREGDTALNMGNIMGDFYDASAEAVGKSKWWSLAGDTLSFAGSTAMQYNIGQGSKKK